MLCLSRGRNEAVVIGEGADAIVVKVLEMSCGKVRLGITAPRDVLVLRHEVAERIREQEAAAARASAAQASGG